MRALHWDTKLSLSLCQLTLSLELLELLDELLEDWGTSTVVVLPDSVWKVWPSLWAAVLERGLGQSALLLGLLLRHLLLQRFSCGNGGVERVLSVLALGLGLGKLGVEV